MREQHGLGMVSVTDTAHAYQPVRVLMTQKLKIEENRNLYIGKVPFTDRTGNET